MRRNKKRETTILLVLASVTAFLLCIGCISAQTGYLFKNKTHLKNTPVVLSTNWKTDGKTVTLPFSTKGVNEVVITHTVTADEAEKTKLLVEHNHQNMMVVLDGKVIYQLGAVNDRRASSMYGSVAIEVNLKEGSELGIMYFGLNGRECEVAPSLLGTDSEILTYVIRNDAVTFILILYIVFILMTVSAIYAYSKYRKVAETYLGWLILFLTAVGLWMFTGVKMVSIITEEPFLTNYCSYMLLMSIPCFFAMYTYNRCTEWNTEWLKKLAWLGVANIAIQNLFYVFNVFSLYDMVSATQLILLGSVTVCVYTFYRDSRERDSKRVFSNMFTFLFALVATVTCLVIYWKSKSGNYMLLIEILIVFFLLETLFTVIFSMIDDIYKGEMSQRKLNIYEELSVKDALTSLGNRRAFDIHMEEIDKSPFDNAYLLFLDVNGLKEANDHYGHAQGDRLLKRTAEVILKTFTDCGCYRIGGDEFAVIVENPVMSDKEYLQILADNVKEENRNEIFELSVAVGLSQLYDGDTRRSISLWKSLADKEMYAEKLRSRLMLGESQLEADDIDEQTGILNQVGFRKHLMRVVMEHPKKQFALWYCDIKKFKFVNDFFGYERGDELLKFWATTTSSCLGELDICGHWIADTLVMLTTYTNDEVLHQRFDSICNVIGPYLKDPRMNYYVELTAGIYLLQQKDMESPDLNQMMDWAHMAQKSVKTKIGSNMAIFGEEMWHSQWRELYINQSLEKAIESKEIEVYFQPQYNYLTGEIIGAEALSRWKHSSLGWISPGEFIPALEKTGAIHILDRYVWEQACILMSKWRDSDMLLPVSISVNISRMDFLDENIVQILKNLVQKYNLPPSMLRLEITESAYIEQPDMLVGVVNLLHQNGFTVELDDFGSGFSSLNVLKDMQVDIIKMDVRFIETTKELKKGSRIIRAMIRMAHELEIPVITEGVETKEQAVFISGIGCAMMQGYYFSKPIPVEQFEDLLMTARERKNRMEEDKKHREKDLERVINSPVYMLWYSDYLLDSNLAIIRVDENFERATGYTWDDVISNHMHQMDLIPPDDLQDYMSLVDKTQNTGKIAGIQHRIRRKDGTDVMVYCTGTPAVDELTGEYNTEVRIQMTEE